MAYKLNQAMFFIVIAIVFTKAFSEDKSFTKEKDMLHPSLQDFIETRVSEFDQIPAERKNILQELANYVRNKRDGSCQLIFICTHNSRRSHMSQLWAAAAAAHYQISNVATFSGGTESTAFNPRAVAALKRAGMQIETDSPKDENPKYLVRFASDQKPIIAYSKRFDSPPNPIAKFGAVMTCSDADKNCPVVQGAEFRISIPFIDPKKSDGTAQESATYDERCAQIAREMLYVFSLVK